MKSKLLMMAGIVFLTAFVSCESTADSDATTSETEENAVLVEDPNNTLNANPVNDTTVADTVRHR